MKKIIHISKPDIGEKEKKNVLKCLKSGWISGAIPELMTALIVAANVTLGTITSSPGPMPNVFNAS